VHVEPTGEIMEQFTESKHKDLPGFGITLFTILLPVLLMLLATITGFVSQMIFLSIPPFLYFFLKAPLIISLFIFLN
ncbi:GntT/GntP/DsdX family permease, partial [Priestia megaterium]|uniref:GntT/GntP/DsdX family permease n=1 Tax=Priestia megaterium TaxID=1404 RepID=UPI003B5F804B